MEIDDLGAASALLVWDQQTYMPPGGSAARGRQLATLGRLAHEKFTDPAIGRLLEQLRPLEASLPPDSPDRALVHVARHDYEKTVKVPADFMAEYIEHGAQSFQAWTVARPANDFKMMLPYVEKTLDLSRQYAEYLGPYDHIADPLIDASDEGMTVASVRAVFTELREQLLPIVRAIAEQPVA